MLKAKVLKKKYFKILPLTLNVSRFSAQYSKGSFLLRHSSILILSIIPLRQSGLALTSLPRPDHISKYLLDQFVLRCPAVTSSHVQNEPIVHKKAAHPTVLLIIPSLSRSQRVKVLEVIFDSGPFLLFSRFFCLPLHLVPMDPTLVQVLITDFSTIGFPASFLSQRQSTLHTTNIISPP